MFYLDKKNNIHSYFSQRKTHLFGKENQYESINLK